MTVSKASADPELNRHVARRVSSAQGVERPKITNAQRRHAKEAVVRMVRTRFHRIHFGSSNDLRTLERSEIQSGVPAPLMPSLSGTLTTTVMTTTTR